MLKGQERKALGQAVALPLPERCAFVTVITAEEELLALLMELFVDVRHYVEKGGHNYILYFKDALVIVWKGNFKGKNSGCTFLLPPPLPQPELIRTGMQMWIRTEQ